MQFRRALVVGLGVTLAFPQLAAAQAGRPFENAWFWGIQAGGLTYGAPSATSAGGNYAEAPTAGIEWLITRTHAGLYASLTQAFLSNQALILNGPAKADSGYRTVDIKNMRTVDVALMAFPHARETFHPYVGAGMTFNDIAAATAEGPFTSQDQIDFANSSIQTLKAAFTPMLIAGAQWKLPMMSAFGQVKLAGTNKNFLLYAGRPTSLSWAIGLRYNVGSSIADDK